MKLGGNSNERLGIKLTVDKALADEFAVEIATILNGKPPELQGNDDLIVSWVLNIEYLGGVRERLAAIERMLEHPGVVKGVRTEELSAGRSLVQDVFLKLERIEQNFPSDLTYRQSWCNLEVDGNHNHAHQHRDTDDDSCKRHHQRKCTRRAGCRDFEAF